MNIVPFRYEQSERLTMLKRFISIGTDLVAVLPYYSEFVWICMPGLNDRSGTLQVYTHILDKIFAINDQHVQSPISDATSTKL